MAARLVVHDTEEALAASLCALVADEAARTPGRMLLGCATGRTFVPTYRALVRRGLDRDRIVAALMDEYLVGGALASPDAHFSCVGFARRELPGVEVWVPGPGYDERLADAGGVGVFLVGSGATDGHVAFRGPGSARTSRTEVVELARTTRLDNLATFPAFGGLDEVPTHGISVGLATIADARRVVLALSGAGKLRAAEEVLSRRAFDPAWPASIVHDANGEIHVTRDAIRTASSGSPRTASR